MIDDAAATCNLKPDSVIIEPTSGDTIVVLLPDTGDRYLSTRCLLEKRSHL